MGMTIEDVELWAKKNNFTIVADEWWEAAQDIICKYQKIAQIYQKWDEVNDFSYNQAMSQIGEVLKDGKV